MLSNDSMFAVLKHVYIPLLFFSGVDYIDAPTPYMMGLHSGVDTFGLVMDGVCSSFDINILVLLFLLRLFSSSHTIVVAFIAFYILFL